MSKIFLFSYLDSLLFHHFSVKLHENFCECTGYVQFCLVNVQKRGRPLLVGEKYCQNVPFCLIFGQKENYEEKISERIISVLDILYEEKLPPLSIATLRF